MAFCELQVFQEGVVGPDGGNRIRQLGFDRSPAISEYRGLVRGEEDGVDGLDGHP